MLSTLKSQKGIGLIEILIAMVLFGIGLSFAMRTLPDSNIIMTRGRNVTKATQFAQEKLEQLMSIPYSDADLTAGTHNDPDNPIDRTFTRSWTVTDNSPLQDMKTVNVTVSFQTGSADSTVTVSTFITSRR
ncbi:MAG: prepilin-type N-terminal cleavage/methylation domain-containing protein [Candidatus Latescibacterota bacterium]|nr:MAG: prepilin-type N-terminal cleavage/methylation domain-containing protein [Candidatus Latescibacterota bacterium]